MKKINIFISIITILSLSWFVYFVVLGNGRSGHYYSSPEREVEQLSDEYYLGPTINENNDKISNVVHYEILDGITKSASPIGYYIQFDYTENDINSEVFIESYPFERSESTIKNSNIYLYKEYEIYLWESLDEERNIVGICSYAILDEWLCTVSLGLISPDDINFNRYQEISLEFMFELIDNYENSNVK